MSHIIGTKAENEDERKVTKEELREWCEKNSIENYYEIAGKQHELVEQVFKAIAKACLLNPKQMLESIKIVRKQDKKSECSC